MRELQRHRMVDHLQQHFGDSYWSQHVSEFLAHDRGYWRGPRRSPGFLLPIVSTFVVRHKSMASNWAGCFWRECESVFGNVSEFAADFASGSCRD